ncbi:hypothetical protein NE865_14704 [Phthorimaea operculella]|nr:hypothetical protein NE865_14704 [Phthorimaea operculella]
MSVHWNTNQQTQCAEIAKWEYRELQATAMSVDYTGNNVLLAGRRWLAIKQICLDEDAGDIVKKYPRHSKYDAACAEWCQNYQGQKLCAIASNQRVDVYEWRGSNDLTCICSLRGHTRVVSDTHFHRQDHNLIATCSIDTFTHLWDLRDARKPVVSLCAVGQFLFIYVTQLSHGHMRVVSDTHFHRQDHNLIATCSIDTFTHLWDLRDARKPVVSFGSHFQRQDHNLIATCSIDTFTHLWDLRDARKPVVSLCAVAGASQVQWNKVATHIVATAHDGDIKIWDYRKPSAPIHYISAHLCKIHGVDWSPHHEYQLVTSSHDGSIKYFDINNARGPENVIMTNFPVWRAIYTPFGSGLLTIGVGWGGLPRAEQAGVIGIWVGGSLTHRLVGHTDTVQTMVWRPNTSPANYQLVTWGRDQSLRVWAMQPSLLKMCNHYLPDDTSTDNDEDSDGGSYASTMGSVNDLSKNDSSQDIEMNKLSHKPGTSIDEEFESIREMANIEVTDMNIETRTCQIHSERNGYVANLQVTFPKNVSEQTIPKFSWLSGTNIDAPTTIKILQAINRTAYRKKREGHRCLLHCLKTLATAIDEIPVKSSDDPDSMKSSQRSQSECENAGDSCIPFPRTCSAKWCGVSTLVVFNRPPNARRLSLKHETGTPRSMSSLSLTPGLFGAGYNSVSPHATTTPSPTNAPGFPQLHIRHLSNSITTFYFQDRWKAQGRRAGSMRSRGSISGGTAPRVVLYSATNLFPLNRSLAERYVINAENPVEMCEKNAVISAEEGDSELAHAWGVAALTARSLRTRVVDQPTSGEDGMGWVGHPLCCYMLQSLISHYAMQWDLQSAAMLACAFSVFNDASHSSDQSTISTSSNWDLQSAAMLACAFSVFNDASHSSDQSTISTSSNWDLQSAAMLACAFSVFNDASHSSDQSTISTSSNWDLQWDLQSAAMLACAFSVFNDASHSSDQSTISTSSNWDLQSAAMLACAFSVFNDASHSSDQSTISTSSNGNGTSPYNTVNQYSEISADGWTLPIMRSNSCSEAENFYTDSSITKSERASACVLDESTVHLYHCFKRAYADILHRWQLLYKKTEVLKLVSCKYEKTPPKHVGPEIVVECAWCGRAALSAVCAHCRRLALRCAVCALGVRGRACACVYCGHAGHADHMIKW